MGISRNTVRRYLRLPEPVRVEREPRRKPVLERVQPRLDALLEEWSGRTTAKQRLTATRLHRHCAKRATRSARRWYGTTCASGGAGAPRSTCRWCTARAEAQVDFFEVTVELGGERRKAWKFLMR